MAPNNRLTVTQLSILFDEILLPGTYLPLNRIDKVETLERIKQIEAVDKERGQTSHEMLLPLYFALEYKELAGIFTGTGKPGYMGTFETGSEDLTKKIEEAYFGPPEPGFIPTPTAGFNFSIGNTDVFEDQINGPAMFSYPANAYLYAQKHNLPIITDTNFMPIPSISNQPVNADLLTAHLSMSALSLVLPKLRPLSAEDILSVRTHMKKDIVALNATMSAYGGRLRQLAGEGAEIEDIQREAEFIAKTEIYPQIEYLKRTMETPGGVIKRNMLDLGMENPELITSLIMQPHNIELWMRALKATGKALNSIIGDLRDESQRLNSSGLGLLLKLPKKYRR